MRTFNPSLGRVMVTAGVAAMLRQGQAAIVERVRGFNSFGQDNDPHGEHDFGSFEIDGQNFYFKIDYYDPALEFGSEDLADPKKTTRVLTIMLAEEY